jgi:hypothetical protein
MGMYTMCPACKSANRPCKARNCGEVLRAISARYSGKPGPHSPIPALRYPPSLWSRLKDWGRRMAIYLVGKE